MEQKIKILIGDLSLTVLNLQTQVEELQKKIKEFEDKGEVS